MRENGDGPISTITLPLAVFRNDIVRGSDLALSESLLG
jgi:hypothetical protein